MSFRIFCNVSTKEELVLISSSKENEIYTLTFLFTKEFYYNECIKKLKEKNKC